MDIKDPPESLAKSRWAITGTMKKLQIPALAYNEHCTSGTAMLPAMMQPVATAAYEMNELLKLQVNEVEWTLQW